MTKAIPQDDANKETTIMPSERNQQLLTTLLDRMRDKPLIVTARYSNVNASQMNDLRRDITSGGGRMLIAKNNIVKLAADELGISGIESIIDGPTAYVIADDDIAATVKALTTSIKDQSIEIEILGGVMENELINAQRVAQIADLPSKDQLIAILASSMNGPLMSLARVLNAPVQNLASALEQIAEQRRTAEAEAA